MLNQVLLPLICTTRPSYRFGYPVDERETRNNRLVLSMKRDF